MYSLPFYLDKKTIPVLTLLSPGEPGETSDFRPEMERWHAVAPLQSAGPGLLRLS